MSDIKTETEMRKMLADEIEQHPSLAQLAQKIGVSGSFMSEVAAGRKTLGNKVLAYLGYQAVTIYRRIPEKEPKL